MIFILCNLQVKIFSIIFQGTFFSKFSSHSNGQILKVEYWINLANAIDILCYTGYATFCSTTIRNRNQDQTYTKDTQLPRVIQVTTNCSNHVNLLLCLHLSNCHRQLDKSTGTGSQTQYSIIKDIYSLTSITLQFVFRLCM